MQRSHSRPAPPLIGLLILLMISPQVTGATPSDHEEGGAQDRGRGHHKEREQGHHHSFKDPSKWAEKWEGSERDQTQKPSSVLDHCEINQGMTVVDLGAGTGYFTSYLASRVGEEGSVLALDAEAEMVEWLRERAQREGWTQVQTRRVPPNNPELSPHSVDVILIVNVWHHLDGRQAYLALLKRALKPTGSLCIVDLKLDAPHGPPKSFRLTLAQLTEELERGGMKRFRTLDLPHQYVISAGL